MVTITTDGTDISFTTKSTGTASTIVINAGTGAKKNAVANLFSVDTAAHAATDLGIGKIVGTSSNLNDPKAGVIVRLYDDFKTALTKLGE